MLDPIFDVVFGIIAWSVASTTNFLVSAAIAFIAGLITLAYIIRRWKDDAAMERRRSAYLRSGTYRADDV